MHKVDNTFKKLVTEEEFKKSVEHVFTVEPDDYFRSVVPSPLAESFAMEWRDEFSAWEWIVHIREHHVSGNRWPIDKPLECAKCLWSGLSDIPVSEDDKIETSFLHFEIGTDKDDVWHWFEEYFNLSIATDLMYIN